MSHRDAPFNCKRVVAARTTQSNRKAFWGLAGDGSAITRDMSAKMQQNSCAAHEIDEMAPAGGLVRAGAI